MASMIAERAAVRSTRWRALGTDVELLTSGAGLSRHEAAVAWMSGELDAVDLACSRFRADSELSEVNRRAGRQVRISARFADLLSESLRIAALTGGLVVPTLGRPLSVLGYDRDLSLVRVGTGSASHNATRATRTATRLVARQDWADVELDRGAEGDQARVRIPTTTALDLGSIGKAAAADRIAAGLGAEILRGVDALVNLGGDIAILRAQSSEDPERTLAAARSWRPDPMDWEIEVDESGRDEPRRPRTSVRIADGGLATSSTVVRTWSQRGVRRHHIIDPRTGLPAAGHWRCVSAHAANASEANAATTAAIVLGPAAPDWLSRRGLSARLVASDGSVVRVGSWPADRAPRSNQSVA